MVGTTTGDQLKTDEMDLSSDEDAGHHDVEEQSLAMGFQSQASSLEPPNKQARIAEVEMEDAAPVRVERGSLVDRSRFLTISRQSCVIGSVAEGACMGSSNPGDGCHCQASTDVAQELAQTRKELESKTKLNAILSQTIQKLQLVRRTL